MDSSVRKVEISGGLFHETADFIDVEYCGRSGVSKREQFKISWKKCKRQTPFFTLQSTGALTGIS